jgi:cytochrome c biogenesis protein CcmG, thiol:disulfide interchange protein DsbE
MRRVLIGSAVALLVFAAVFHKHLLQHAVSTPDPKRLVVGDKVPDFEVADLTGKVVTLSDLQKRTDSGVVSLTFWCTTCHSCRMMDARFQKLAAEWKEKATVVGIDANAADTTAKVEDFIRARKFSVPVLLDANGKAADLFGVRLTTTTVVIDKVGVLRYWGQFGGEDSPYVGNALRAVLDGKDVTVRETSPSG